ncbi:MAG: Rrf2 family transcriptional regulator [Putridiphycobacter sp.]|nr:Rrf2 family transcriptional regulator [Putridiphycobacter sp.]
MLTNSSKYAVRSVIFLALNSNDKKKYSAKDIAKHIDVPAQFLAKTLQILTKKKVISSSKGPHGGFYLSKKNGEGRLTTVIETIDGLEKINGCFLGLPACNVSNPCPVHHLVAPFRDNFMKEISSKTILEFSQKNSGYSI